MRMRHVEILVGDCHWQLMCDPTIAKRAVDDWIEWCGNVGRDENEVLSVDGVANCLNNYSRSMHVRMDSIRAIEVTDG